MSSKILTPKMREVLEALRANAEGAPIDGWSDVYLDNAKPSGMSARSFAGHLSALERADLYRPVDGFAWGSVRAQDA